MVGQIPHAACRPLYSSKSMGMADPTMNEPATDYLGLDFIVKGGRFIVGIQSCPGVAYLNSKITNALSEVIKVAGVEFEIFVEKTRLTSLLGPVGSSEYPNRLHIDIVVLGPMAAGQSVGEALSKHGAYLQDPRSRDDARRYFNPQVLDLEVSESEIMLHELFMEMAAKRSKAEQGSAWNDALDDMSQHVLNVNAVDVDTAIVVTPILSSVMLSKYWKIGSLHVSLGIREKLSISCENESSVEKT